MNLRNPLRLQAANTLYCDDRPLVHPGNNGISFLHRLCRVGRAGRNLREYKSTDFPSMLTTVLTQLLYFRTRSSYRLGHLPMSVPSNCNHIFNLLKSDSTLIQWVCSQCHSGPHWCIFQCKYCKWTTCEPCKTQGVRKYVILRHSISSGTYIIISFRIP